MNMATITREGLRYLEGKVVTVYTRVVQTKGPDYLTQPSKIEGRLESATDSHLHFSGEVNLFTPGDMGRRGRIGPVPYEAVKIVTEGSETL